MGQKVRPTSLRLGIVEDWRSRWFATKSDFSKCLIEDEKIRRFLKQRYRFAAITKVEIERRGDQLTLTLHTARPGIVIGRRGVEVDRMRDNIEDLIGRPVTINIREISRPELDAQLVAESVCDQLEKRMSFRRVMKRAVDATMAAGAEGVKIHLAGRLGGSEMARRESYSRGKIPLHTLRAKIDYGFSEAVTQYGHIGVKVWIYLGEVAKEEDKPSGADAQKG